MACGFESRPGQIFMNEFQALFSDWIKNTFPSYLVESRSDSSISVVYVPTENGKRWLVSAQLFDFKVRIWNGAGSGLDFPYTYNLGDPQLFDHLKKFIENTEPSKRVYSI